MPAENSDPFHLLFIDFAARPELGQRTPHQYTPRAERVCSDGIPVFVSAVAKRGPTWYFFALDEFTLYGPGFTHPNYF